MRSVSRHCCPPCLLRFNLRSLINDRCPVHFAPFRDPGAGESASFIQELCDGGSCFIIRNHPFSYKDGAPEIPGSFSWSPLVFKVFLWFTYIVGKTGGAQLFSIPELGLLPHIQNAGILIWRPIPWNYYQNAVISNYSFAWWDWKRWGKEIDWMALQGINLPLAFMGQEAVWQKVFKKFNISSSDLDDFFGGPAFLAWSRMGNLHGWGGPLPQSWFDDQLSLQKKFFPECMNLE